MALGTRSAPLCLGSCGQVVLLVTGVAHCWLLGAKGGLMFSEEHFWWGKNVGVSGMFTGFFFSF